MAFSYIKADGVFIQIQSGQWNSGDQSRNLFWRQRGDGGVYLSEIEGVQSVVRVLVRLQHRKGVGI